jgi:ParB family chromosome partitioning protein
VTPKNRLGKGLQALLPDDDDDAPAPVAAGKGGEVLLPLDKLKANPGQPRKNFDGEALEELAASIKEHGVIQPIIAEDAGDGTYIIVAGERRTRAARLAGLREVPALIRDYSDEKRLEIALIENVQRADLNPIEEAAAYKKLMELTGLSQDETSAKVGKNRATVANALRLLKLPKEMQEALERDEISSGHGRAILSVQTVSGQETLFREILDKGLSVRETEARSAVLNGGRAEGGEKVKSGGTKRDPELAAMEQRFIDRLGTKVNIRGDFKKGNIQIEYYSMDDLDRLLGLLG